MIGFSGVWGKYYLGRLNSEFKSLFTSKYDVFVLYLSFIDEFENKQ